jgi:hypothetical protein
MILKNSKQTIKRMRTYRNVVIIESDQNQMTNDK